MANGIADNMLVTTYLSCKAPVFVAPAMDLDMFAHPTTQQNLERLRSFGNRIIEPATGELASHLVGKGRMEEPDKIIAVLEDFFSRKQMLEGKKILITAGPTYEKIDPVRFIGNYSSGKMGFAIAEAARDRGAQVVLISGPVTLRPPEGVEYVSITTAAELCQSVLSRAEDCDIVIQAAAPADFRPKSMSVEKIKKTGRGLTLELENTTDIAAALGARKREGQILVAFAAETSNLTRNARQKLEKKNADLVVANDVTRPGAGFQGDTNAVTIFSRTDAREIPMNGKREIAEAILDRVAELF